MEIERPPEELNQSSGPDESRAEATSSNEEDGGRLGGDSGGGSQPVGEAIDLGVPFAGGAQDLPPDGEDLS